MDLSQSVLSGVSLAGDDAHIPSKIFPSFVEIAFRGILNQSEKDAISKSPGFEKLDQAVLKEAYAGFVALLIEAAKHDTEIATLGTVLEDCKFTEEKINKVSTIYKEKKQSLQILLGSTGNPLPHIVDVDWRLDYNIKNNHLEKVNEPVYLVSLKTEVAGKPDLQEVQFSCSQEQLQDLVGKLKDASKCLEKISL